MRETLSSSWPNLDRDDATEDELDHDCGRECYRDCDCGRGRYRGCKHRSCYECFLDRLADHVQCIFCGRWHSPDFDTCFKCRPESRGRDDAARALRQLILWRDQYQCRYCGAVEGDMQIDKRLIRPACPGMRHTRLHVDHIVPCKRNHFTEPARERFLAECAAFKATGTWDPAVQDSWRQDELREAA